jgi:hypothetical protein
MIKIYTLLLAFVVAGLTVSCDKSIDDGEQLKSLTPADIDADAGTWKMIVLTTPNQVAVAAPAAITSDAYIAELTAIKDAQSKLTSAQRDVINYWSAGGIMRWNQKLRELVARFNLPPAPKADNTYPAPDAENPFADPNFPFSNPPYAVRAYSYISVGQYEAMKAAWYYKYQYNRPAPYKNDTGIQALMPQTDLPSYPSEDAVMSGVTADLMKLLFPAAVEEITLMAASQRNAALWSGKASSTDISVGLALGKSIAALMQARAGGDGMGAAAGNAALWKQLLDNVGNGNFASTGQTAWTTRDIPARPPMLPNFGKVKAWNLTAQDIVNVRPLPPPRTASAEMQQEIDEVKYFSDNITRERLAIVHKWADGAATYTPPGHWNDIATEYIRDANYSEVRAARAYAILNMAMHDAMVSCWETKFYYFNPRPSQMDPRIKTTTGIPNFPAFTSGHSNFSGAAAEALSYLFPANSTYFHEQATEAALSRLYGGIHYRSDVEVGLDQGKNCAQFTINYAEADGADN